MSGTVFLQCPECTLDVEVSPEDGDASFSELLCHIQYTHPNTDMSPAVLWPRIEEVVE